jgi:hypothetical protein
MQFSLRRVYSEFAVEQKQDAVQGVFQASGYRLKCKHARKWNEITVREIQY